MAVVRRWRDTAYGVTGYPCHGGCGHVFEYGETIWQLGNVSDPYVYWCDSCASQFPISGELSE